LLLVEFTVEGDPIPKGRPRAGSGRVYTPARTRDAEATVGLYARQAMQGRDPVTCDVILEAHFYTKTKRRVDIDNLLKTAMDAIGGIVFVNDDQVVQVTARKHHFPMAPGTVVRVFTTGGEP
jgi:crossover junction endodeoxyribonuclease RusA